MKHCSGKTSKVQILLEGRCCPGWGVTGGPWEGVTDPSPEHPVYPTATLMRHTGPTPGRSVPCWTVRNHPASPVGTVEGMGPPLRSREGPSLHTNGHPIPPSAGQKG